MFTIILNSNQNLLVTIENWIGLFDLTSKDPIFELENNVNILHGIHLPQKNLLIFSDLDKKLHIFDVKTKTSLATSTLAKRSSKLIYSSDESCLLIGDRTGDVYTFKLNLDKLNESEAKHLMGSLSVLTDMRLNSKENLLITSDRDEKIRISCYPNSYNIDSYLLGHKEFVSQIELVGEDRLVSSSGDSTIILWNIKEAKSIQKLDLTKHFSEKEKPKGVVSFHFDSSTKRILVQMFGTKSMLLFNYVSLESNEEIQFISKIELEEKFQAFIGLSNYMYLFVHIDKNLENVFSLKKLDNESNQLNQVYESAQTSSILAIAKFLTQKLKTQKVDYIRNDLEKEYLGYFKMIMNNLDEYYERKSKRILAKEAKRQRINSDNKK